MSCYNGRIKIKEAVKYRLFAQSAGHCQNPGCLENLLLDIEGAEFLIAELAHIIAVKVKGPRGNTSPADRNSGQNLIVLCPTCHTKIDKAPTIYPEILLQKWKLQHAQKIQSVFGVGTFETRTEARKHIDRLLSANKTIFEYCGPHKYDRWDAECELAVVWLKRVRSDIIPNNRKILTLLDANHALLNDLEKQTLDEFRIHVEDLESKHLFKGLKTVASRFPAAMPRIFED